MFFPRITTLNRLHGRAWNPSRPPPPQWRSSCGTMRSREHLWQEAQDPALLRPVAQPALWVDRLQRAQLAQHGVNSLRATRRPARDEVGAVHAGRRVRPPARKRACWARVDCSWICQRQHRAWHALGQHRGQHARAPASACAGRWRSSCASWPRPVPLPAPIAIATTSCSATSGSTVRRSRPHGVFRLIYGYQSAHAATRLTWLVEHRPAASSTRPVSLNQLAAPRASGRIWNMSDITGHVVFSHGLDGTPFSTKIRALYEIAEARRIRGGRGGLPRRQRPGRARADAAGFLPRLLRAPGAGGLQSRRLCLAGGGAHAACQGRVPDGAGPLHAGHSAAEARRARLPRSPWCMAGATKSSPTNRACGSPGRTGCRCTWSSPTTACTAPSRSCATCSSTSSIESRRAQYVS